MQSLSSISTPTVRPLHLLLALLVASRWVVYGFTDVALTAVLRKAGVSLEQISLLMGVGFLFMFKFLWAPMVDRVALFGRPGYKTWFLWMQGACAVALLGLLLLEPAQDFYAVLGLLAAASIAATFRDIAMDGLAVKVLAVDERASANGWMSAGFMVGLVLGGGVLLLAYDHIGWSGAVWMIVLGTLLPLPIMLAFREPERAPDAAAPSGGGLALWASLRAFFAAPGHLQWAGIILLMAAAGITGPSLLTVMLIDNGWSLARVGTVTTIIGPLLAAALSLGAGYAFERVSRRTAVVSMLALAALMSFLQIPVATNAFPEWLVILVVIAVVVVASLTNIAQKIVVTDKSAATPDFGSNFTVQASLAQIGGILAHMAAPALASVTGYPTVLAVGGVLGGVAALVLFRYRHL